MAVRTVGSGSTLSNELDDLLVVINKLKDNNTNLIEAKDVRDSIYTLWLRSEDANGSNETTFVNSDPVPVKVGGIDAGTTFENPTDMQEMWNKLLYPYIPLSSSLTLSGASIREFGNPSGLSTNSLTLNWSVDKKTNPITLITVDGQIFIPTGLDQSGTKLTSGTHSVTGNSQETNQFSMSSSDGTETSNSSVNLIWQNRIYWGRIDLSSLNNPNLSSLNNPNLSSNPGAVVAISGLVTSELIKGLKGAGVGKGNELSNSKNKNYNGINGGGQHLIFAWPSSVSGSKTPSFTVNGQPNSAFTRVRTDWTFENIHGFVSNYEIWITNTVQNSPIGTFQIS
jgi:hypothetical protein